MFKKVICPAVLATTLAVVSPNALSEELDSAPNTLENTVSDLDLGALFEKYFPNYRAPLSSANVLEALNELVEAAEDVELYGDCAKFISAKPYPSADDRDCSIGDRLNQVNMQIEFLLSRLDTHGDSAAMVKEFLNQASDEDRSRYGTLVYKLMILSTRIRNRVENADLLKGPFNREEEWRSRAFSQSLQSNHEL